MRQWPVTLFALLMGTSFAGFAHAHAGHDHGGATAPARAEAAEPTPGEATTDISGNTDGAVSCGEVAVQPADMVPECGADCAAVDQAAADSEPRTVRPVDCSE